MQYIGSVVMAIIMTCACIGCLASVIRPESELGKQFVAGIDAIGPIFLPTVGIMASAPYLTAFVTQVFGPLYSSLGADPAMAATTYTVMLSFGQIASNLVPLAIICTLLALGLKLIPGAMIKDFRARDKVIVIAYGVGSAFLFGDHLSFTANFQPSLILPVMVGKFIGGVCAVGFAYVLAVKKAEELERADLLRVQDSKTSPAIPAQSPEGVLA